MVAAAIIGAEVGAAFGLVFFGFTPFAPLLTAVLGALAGPAVAVVVRGVRVRAFGWALRRRLHSEP
jgi:hypothetical protein